MSTGLMRKRSFILLLAWLCLPGPVHPRQDPSTCGTHIEKAKEQLQLHRQAVRRAPKAGLRLMSPATRASDIGEIAILEDSGDLVARYNAFDLAQKTVTFRAASPSANRYTFETGAGSYDQAAAAGGTLLTGLRDDDSREISLPFPFPFYGNSYERVFVNSDGNLTFLSPDNDTGDRSLGRMVSGPPRIAPLFEDLDPTMADDGVRVLLEPSRVVVSWVGVPEYSDYYFGRSETFQIRLYPDGRVEYAYAGVVTDQAVVGISPGGTLGVTSLVTFSEANSGEFSGTVAERFSYLEEVDIFTAGLKFYETHEDAYDYLVLFNNMGVAAGPNALAYEVTARSVNRSGFGDTPADIGAQFGSTRRLQSVMNLGPLSQYPSDPDARVPGRGYTTGDTPMTVLGHEAGHLFLAFASVREPYDPELRPMLKPDGVHWSFDFNSEASLLEGNRIRDNGDGTFTTTGTVEGYSLLDQYLMGFRPPADVPPTFLVENSNVPPSTFSSVNVSFNGSRRSLDVAEIERAEGRRSPDSTVAQRRFRFAFILIVPQGAQPSAADIEKIEAYRSRFSDYYSRYAGGQASAEATLRRSLRLSLAPAAGVPLGSPISATVSIEKPASSPLTVTLERSSGFVSLPVPSSVTIDTGTTSSTFQIAGLAVGADELTARPSDPQYETAYARIQVSATPSALRLSAVPADGQGGPVVLRVTDLNLLPYPGLRVRASAAGGGTVAPDVDTSDEDGLVRFQWTLGMDGVQQLFARLEGATPGEVGGVVNAASYGPAIAPGSFAAIFGSNMTGGEAVAAGPPPYPNELGGVQVFVDGELAGLHYSSNGQINFVVPPDTQEGAADLVVSAPGGASVITKMPVVAAAPGIFFDPISGVGWVLRDGDFLQIYCTGLGDAFSVRVYLGDVRLTSFFSGQSGFFPGLDEVDVRVPAGVSGAQTLSIEVDGRRSNEVVVFL
jgi:uncharacterized protein (TIGR03437 family)